MEREISDFRQTRERQLQEQLMRVREGIVKEITDVVMEKVKANQSGPGVRQVGHEHQWCPIPAVLARIILILPTTSSPCSTSQDALRAQLRKQIHPPLRQKLRSLNI